jgi:hypothetical protein
LPVVFRRAALLVAGGVLFWRLIDFPGTPVDPAILPTDDGELRVAIVMQLLEGSLDGAAPVFVGLRR